MYKNKPYFNKKKEKSFLLLLWLTIDIHLHNWFLDWQLVVGWGTDSSDYVVLDFTTIPYTVIVPYSHLSYLSVKFW